MKGKAMPFSAQQLSDFVHETHAALLVMSKALLDLQERYETDALRPGRSPRCRGCVNCVKGNYGRYNCGSLTKPILTLTGCDQFFSHADVMKAAKKVNIPSQAIEVRRVKKKSGKCGVLLVVDSSYPLDAAEVERALMERFGGNKKGLNDAKNSG